MAHHKALTPFWSGDTAKPAPTQMILLVLHYLPNTIKLMASGH